MKPCLVKWIDITHSAGWHSIDETRDYVKDYKDGLVIQVGFIFSQTKSELILVDSWIGDGENLQYGVIHKIPAGCILEIKELI